MDDFPGGDLVPGKDGLKWGGCCLVAEMKIQLTCEERQAMVKLVFDIVQVIYGKAESAIRLSIFGWWFT